MSSDVVSESVAKILRCGPSGIDEAIMRLGGQTFKVIEPKIRTTISPRYPLPDLRAVGDNVIVQVRAAETGSVVYSQRNDWIMFPEGQWQIMSTLAMSSYATITLAKLPGEGRDTWLVTGITGNWRPSIVTYWEEDGI